MAPAQLSDNDQMLAWPHQVARGVASAHPLMIAKGAGARLWDAAGIEYLDFVGGIGVLNVGHCHPRVVAAATAQLQRLTHTACGVSMYEPYVELSTRLNALIGRERRTKSVLLTTGVEAIENAVKIARAFTGRSAVVAFDGAFHGRTLLGMTLTASNAVYQQNFGPFASDVYHAPYPYEYRGWTTERALDALGELFSTRVAPDRVAALLIEPQLGEGGFVPASVEFMRELRRLATLHGIVLIVDEIQTGFGRTGAAFAYEHSGIEPDLVTLAKSLAAGFPLSAVVGRAEIVDAPAPGGLGGTYAGNPVACAAALAVLDVFEEEQLVERGRMLGARLRAGLVELQSRHDCIGDVRGLGAMLAIELVEDREQKAPATALAQRTIDRARSNGLLLLTCGAHKNVVRFLMPLVATTADIDNGLRLLERSLLESAA